MKRYEGMFLFDSAVARDWATIEQEVHRLCDRINGELLACVKFDERKLAYEIQRRRRGTYILTYFEAPPDRIVDLERDVRLSELVLRVLVLQADHVPEEKVNEMKTWPADTALQPLSSDGRRHDDRYGDRGDRGGRGGHRESRDLREAGTETAPEPGKESTEESTKTAEAAQPAAPAEEWAEVTPPETPLSSPDDTAAPEPESPPV